MARLYAYGISITLAVLVISPLFGAFSEDDFPFSSYPMFAGRRSRIVSVATVEQIAPDGSSQPVPPSWVANDEVIQAFETVRQAVRQGPSAVAALCSQVAARMPAGEATELRIQTASYDSLAYFAGDRRPLRVDVHGSCEAPQ